MKHTKLFLLLNFLLCINISYSQVNITIDANADKKAISPYIYGKNGGTSYDSKKPTSESDINIIKESGIRFLRLNNGNNSSKYNWRKKISSHPDWYNNVYSCDWDYSAQELQEKLPNIPGLYAFTLLGYVADNNNNNFNDWEYNSSSWWGGCSQNLAGGGTPNPDGDKALVEGDPMLYLTEWPSDSVVGIYEHWKNNLNLNMDQFQYWSMDNEMEIWGWTHDDMIKPFDADKAMNTYFEVAKAARAMNPDIKLCGPVAASEWTWFNTTNGIETYNGKKYCWLEYFIMRCAEEQKKTGVRMLDVLDLHSYPSDSKTSDIVQTHRIFYDTEYIYPSANGVKTVNGSWDNSIKSEYIFVRCNEWLNKYMGEDHGVTFAVSEYAVKNINTNVTAVTYASHLGEFANNGVEFFTPWDWNVGMWEVIHLFSRYSKEFSIKSNSSDEELVSAYTSINSTNDSITVFIINRSETDAKTINLNIANTDINDGNYESLQLANLPDSETFVSHTENSLIKSTVNIENNSINNLSVPAMSITALVLSTNTNSNTNDIDSDNNISLYPNPAKEFFYVNSNKMISKIEIYNTLGVIEKQIKSTNGDKMIKISTDDLTQSVYYVKIYTSTDIITKQIIIK